MTETPSPFAGTVPVVPLGHGDATVTLVEGQTFALSGRSGDMSVDLPHGVFVLDTRILAEWELTVNGHGVEPLTVDVTEPFAATFVGRAHPPPGRADAELVVFRRRHIGNGMREQITVTNHGLGDAVAIMTLRCDVDFADLFEVKESRVPEVIPRSVHAGAAGMRFVHDEGGMTKTVDIGATDSAAVEPKQFTWQKVLAPREEWNVCLQLSVSIDDELIKPRFRCGSADTEAIPTQRLAEWHAALPTVETDHATLTAALRQTADDLGALRIFDPDHPGTPILAAGAPWFMTVFGRDSLITAWMTLLADPTLARGVLETLARFQGTDVNPVTDEEPGRILHEIRFGASRGLSLRGGDIYYGSIDATPLFVMLLGELRRWDLADDIVDALLPHADRALGWIEAFGDRDGDGYVEYERRTERGLANQGWKDSWDAVRHVSGELARAPIALCEVQGYTYAAYMARAHFANEAGDAATSARYMAKATALRARFNEDFWLDERGWFALGLDGDKRPIEALASNMGHCLWSGIVEPDKAAVIARRMMSDELFSGWGIRTLASSMTAYNPVSYHNGSVWPHDNALCAAGLARYGFIEEAHRVIGAQLDVAAAHQGRLPELFAGFDRGNPRSPAAYPTSCSPQAWAAAAPLLWLRTLLRLDPWAPRGQVWAQPELPPWLRRLRVGGISIAGEHVTIDVDDGHVDVAGLGQLTLVPRARPPVTAMPRP